MWADELIVALVEVQEAQVKAIGLVAFTVEMGLVQQACFGCMVLSISKEKEPMVVNKAKSSFITNPAPTI